MIQNDGQSKIANVLKITKQNAVLPAIDLTQNDNDLKSIELTIQLIDTQLIDGRLFYKGTTSGQVLKVV